MQTLTLEQKKKIQRASLNDPLWFHRSVLGNGALWAGQEAMVRAVRAYRSGKKKISIRAGKNLGKTYLLGEIALWFLLSKPHTLVVTTAPTTRQIKNLLWGEIHKHYMNSRKRLGGKLDSLQLSLRPDWYAIGFSTDKPVNVSGFHSARALVIVDEAQGVPDEVIDELEGVVSGDDSLFIMSGNPTRTAGRYYESFKDPDVEKIHLDCEDHPNVKEGREVFPGMVSKDWVEKRRIRWGENSPLFQSNVKGNFPKNSSEYVVSIDDFDWAKENQVEASDDEPIEAGLDVADSGSNENVFTVRKGNRVLHQSWWSGVETMGTVGKAVLLCNEWKVNVLKIDCIGVGSGVASRLKELWREGKLKTKIIAHNVAETALDSEQYANKRAEMFCHVGNLFRLKQVDLSAIKHDCEELQSQLTSIKELNPNSRGQRRIESKEDMMKAPRNLPSPDRADSFALAFAPAKAPPVLGKSHTI